MKKLIQIICYSRNTRFLGDKIQLMTENAYSIRVGQNYLLAPLMHRGWLYLQGSWPSESRLSSPGIPSHSFIDS